jgi:ATP-binding cassette subfamily B protein
MKPDRDRFELIRALQRAVEIGFSAEPRLFLGSFLSVIVGTVLSGLTGLWLKLLVDGVVKHDNAEISIGAVGMAAGVALGWLSTILATRFGHMLQMRTAVVMEGRVSTLQGSVVTIDHHERPEYLDKLQILKDHVFLLNHLFGTLANFVGLVMVLAVTVVLLMTIHPLLVLLALFAIPAAAAGSLRAGAERRAEDKASPHFRLARHLYEISTDAGSAKDLRVSRNGEVVIARHRQAWDALARTLAAAWWRSGAVYMTAWAVFGLAYVVAILVVTSRLHGSPGNVVLMLAAGGSLARYLGQALSTAQFLSWTLDAAKRLNWLEDYVAHHRENSDQPAPDRIERGIRFEEVSFAYPGTDRNVLQDVSLDLPAGAVVAVVGENGAGKTTLVKLLCRFYSPTAGRITVDGRDLERMIAEDWRSRVAGAFQDFMRFEFRARRTIGLGDLPREESEPAVMAAVARGGAEPVMARLPGGLDTQLGANWTAGVDLSFGQWQKLALSRGFMRDHPLLLVLDEPTAALDAETEHALFERFAAESREGSGDGRITVLVSHRFSTVRMADLIVVLDGARVVETGSHEQLMARHGLYAELYGIQARAYQTRSAG